MARQNWAICEWGIPSLFDDGGVNGGERVLQGFFVEAVDAGCKQLSGFHRILRQIMAVKFRDQPCCGTGDLEQCMTLAHQQLELRAQHVDFVLINSAMHGVV